VPELPEVETIRRQLEPELTGRVIEAARIFDERWTRPAPPRRVARRLCGRRIESVGRRGKYIVLGLDGGDALAMHLRMTGNLLLRDGGGGERRLGGERLYEGSPDSRYLRAALELDGGLELWFTDPRRFGQAVFLRHDQVEPYFAGRVGIEPLSGELTADELAREAIGRTTPLKSFLLDQSHVAGVGNIYADEALWRARLHPLSPAGSMRLEHCEDLRVGIVEALEAGLRAGGASVDDYRDARGERGAMQDEFCVHTRAGEPCLRCDGTIRRIVLGGRSTYFCPGCQRRLRRRPRRARRRLPTAPR
jgi:formamidopyrimidine-DNA glycosylase